MLASTNTARSAPAGFARQPARQSVSTRATKTSSPASHRPEQDLQNAAKRLGAAAAATAVLSLASPAFADFPGFKDILPSSGVEKSAPNAGNATDLNKEDAEKTGASPVGGSVEGPADSTPNIASKQSQVVPNSSEKQERGQELQKTLSQTDDSTVSDSMTGKALQ